MDTIKSTQWIDSNEQLPNIDQPCLTCRDGRVIWEMAIYKGRHRGFWRYLEGDNAAVSHWIRVDGIS